MAEVKPPTPRELGYQNDGDLDFYKYGGKNFDLPELRWPDCLGVYDRMRSSDGQVIAVLKAITLPIIGTTWRINPNGARTEVVKFVAEQLGLPVIGDEGTPKKIRRSNRFSWSEHLRMALLMVPFGSMFFEQVVEPLPTGRWGLRKIAPRMPESLTAINVDRDGGLLSIEQRPPAATANYRAADAARTITIPVDRLVAYSYDREGADWAGRSLLRPAYKHWLIKEKLLKIEVVGVERNSMGVPVYTNPAGATDSQIEVGRKMAESYRAGSSAGASIPNGADLELLGVSGQLLNPRAVIEYHDAQIGKAALAHFLNLDGEGGSYALATVQADLFTQSLSATAEQVADTATQHIVADLVDWNWGPDEPIPAIEFDDIRSTSLEVANALSILANAGLIRADRSTEEWLRRDLGAPVKDTIAPSEDWTPDTTETTDMTTPSAPGKEATDAAESI
ncbi:DUF935 family protein [Corynebacterium aurimucosum]|uniref:phage portal protein family protein n=1 Tax=Corynebacterium aurimucosum TaxID=169292 RepID=UPI00187A9983|nr:DUF935 family protein [Corynebacterium aurimucosum]MBE7338116.1 DUF935 family protein [Corynebacterium aurimucosum]